MYRGPNVPGISFEDAQRFCEENGLGYCHIDGILSKEIPLKDDGDPDWGNAINYFDNTN